MSDWSALLVTARTRLSVSQADLAARSHVSLPTVKAYEQGKRHPSRPYLIAILDALHVSVMERNAILEAAGYAADNREIVPRVTELDLSPEESQAELDRLTWPAFVLNDASEVVFTNSIMERVWGVDLSSEFQDVSERSMLAVASDPRFADRLLNWDEAVGSLAAVYKGHFRGGEDLEEPSPAFKRVLDKFLSGDPTYVARFLKVWQDASSAVVVDLRWHYRMVWDVPGIGAMDLDCVVSHCNQSEAWSFNDWIPRDAVSWAVLDELKARVAAAS